MGKRILVTDFDDTLAQTDANVIVKKASGKTVIMDPAEYAVYDPQEGDNFDFSQFDQLINPRPIQRFVKFLKHALDGKADRVVVLTARGHTRPVAQFLKMHGITRNVAIAALGDSNPEKKAQYIEKQIQNGYDRVLFIDDSPKNVAAVSKLKTKYPDVRLLVHKAEEHPEKTPSGKSDVEVYPISKKDQDFKQIDSWIKEKHYLKKWPKSVQSVLAIKVNGKLSGVLVYGIGTRGQAATDIFGPGVMKNNQLWELQRAFTTDEAKKEVPNLGSMVISRGNELIRTHAKTKDGLPVKAIVSYADSAQGHKGSVYQSTNATYLGEQEPRSGWAITDPNTGNTTTRTTIKASIRNKMSDDGYVVEKVTPETGKHKFLYALGKDQNDRDQLLAKVIKPIFSYPKNNEPAKQIENPAKKKLADKPAQKQASNEPQTKRAIITKLLNSRVKNLDTGNDILVKTALKYPKTHAAYKQARGMVNAYSKRYSINVKPTRESLQEAVYVR
jgi:hypothetical protein